MAYCRWLSAQTGRVFDMPTEVEWEAAARGLTGRRYPWGNQPLPIIDCGNALECHLKGPSPIGIFPASDSPDGISDLMGNVGEWTRSAVKFASSDDIEFRYPYDASDGRETKDSAPNLKRVVRGGGWVYPLPVSEPHVRLTIAPAVRDCSGLRLIERSP
jgi:formylglycine-generating enzyme required for sulfatase activity